MWAHERRDLNPAGEAAASVWAANRFEIVTRIDDDRFEFFNIEQNPLKQANLLNPHKMW